MPETGNHKIPYPSTEDDAKVPADMQALAEKVDSELDDIAPSQIQKQTAGKLLIANASGVITGTAMSGDVTISDAGVTEIGAGKVGTTELGNEGVTTAKVDDEAITSGKLAKTSKPVTWYSPSVIPTEETRTNVAYGTLTTPDQVSGIKISSGQLLIVSFAATWRQSVSEKGRASFFLTREGFTAFQPPVLIAGAKEGQTSAAAFAGAGASAWADLVSDAFGLRSTDTEFGTPAKVMPGAGYLVAGGGKASYLHEFNGAIQKLNVPKEGYVGWGGFAVFQGLIAGTYTVDVRFKSAEGSVTAKERRLQPIVVGQEA